MNKVLIALGTNLGNRSENLENAVARIAEAIGSVTASSSHHSTEPVGAADKEFLNSALVAETALSPEKTLELLLSIELDMGRIRQKHWGNRIIDLDILLWRDSNGEYVIRETESLSIPHPLMHKRTFVLDPASEIAGDWVHPQENKSICALKKILDKI